MSNYLRRVAAVVGVAALALTGPLVIEARLGAQQVAAAQTPQQPWPTVANREVRPPESWEPDIKKFEAADTQTAPPQNGIVFVGSSSIVRWDLTKYLPEFGPSAINRGFGGSVAADTVYYADRIVIPYKPRTVVYYSGDNDVESPITPEQIATAFIEFERKVHKVLPSTRIVYISIKPSLRRWAFQDKMTQANALVKSHIGTRRDITYLDVVQPMLGTDGKPRPELFVQDGLHMTSAGYEIWTAALKPLLSNATRN